MGISSMKNFHQKMSGYLLVRIKAFLIQIKAKSFKYILVILHKIILGWTFHTIGYKTT